MKAEARLMPALPERRRPAGWGHIAPACFAAFLALSRLVAAADVFREWDTLEKRIRDNAIPREEARRRVMELQPLLASASPRPEGASAHYFPVQGGGPRDIGGRNGNGYVPDGFNYYDGRKHTGHPAHDIFIRDVNFDSLADDTGKPVAVLSFSDGVVTAVNRGWNPASDLRGGDYIWIFDPSRDLFYIYAHLGKVLVDPGTAVKAGQTIGHVGRTGRNAFPRRSPTHLHFSCLAYDRGKMTPRDTYAELIKAVRTGP